MLEQLIQKYLKNNNISAKEGIDYDLRDDGQGAYIKDWRVQEIEAPTEEILNNICGECEIKKKLRINSRKAYLNKTDWYIVRETDIPNSYPQAIKDKRILARTEINAIETLNTLAEVEAYNETFE